VSNPQNIVKNHSDDRVLVLKPIEGKATLGSQGLVDNRLVSGENKLHAKKLPGGSMWTLQYESGILPPPLKQSFTSFNKMLAYTTEYFKRRNIDIVDIVDQW